MDDEDWLDDSPVQAPGAKEDPLVDKDWERLATKYNDAGYREGITDGKLSTLQQGFDAGFALSTPLSRTIGNLRGRSTALLTYLLSLGPSGLGTVEEVRDLIRDLGRVRRDEVLPIDHERLAHEEEDRIAREGEGGFELDASDDREMEGLERALEGTTTGGEGTAQGEDRWEGKREGELVKWFEARLGELEEKAFRG